MTGNERRILDKLLLLQILAAVLRAANAVDWPLWAVLIPLWIFLATVAVKAAISTIKNRR